MATNLSISKSTYFQTDGVQVFGLIDSVAMTVDAVYYTATKYEDRPPIPEGMTEFKVSFEVANSLVTRHINSIYVDTPIDVSQVQEVSIEFLFNNGFVVNQTFSEEGNPNSVQYNLY